MIENPMVVDHLWRHLERTPKVVGTCEGCGEEILVGEDVYDFDGELVHQQSSCCMEFIANKSLCKVAGE
ncbi:hypothetical protein NST02_23555 [Robertmurraya sp. FSL W8-0741]|uniref:hypothetical protein n=1 Tax=Robertmurraya TaxID=2837507 RepID=UPI000BA63180|nr:hypothetical protein [Robertmurraya siralis]PAE20537.1 hypothetical protein CHH80_11030 [Bacillus sp. 7504-2]